MNRAVAATILSCSLLSRPAMAADFLSSTTKTPARHAPHSIETIRGRVAVVDGRTLWFPTSRRLVRFDGIDICEQPQWAFNPKATRSHSKAPMPVPCGGFAKAWLKRIVGSKTVSCDIVMGRSDDEPGAPMEGRCLASGQDLALAMLKVGWARWSGPYPADARYSAAQQYAMAARYGMWSTYVLDPSEWREKAVDRTLGRKPVADRNLLSERRSEISPPFVDAARQPRRRDR